MKSERGSIAVLAFVTVMFILIILATLFYSMVEKSKAQVIEMEKLSNTLDGDMGEVYRERKNVQGVFVTLYSDGSLVFNDTRKTLEGKTITKQYGDIKDLTFATEADIPWNADRVSITTVDFANTVTPTNTDMWFSGCNNLTTITNINKLDTKDVISMKSMFKGCTKLASINLTGLSTNKVINMEAMFSGCSAITTLDLSNFNTSNVTTMQSLFSNCSNLTRIYVGSNWSTSNVSSSASMFLGCSNLTGGNGTVYDETITDKQYARIDATGTPGYLTAK